MAAATIGAVVAAGTAAYAAKQTRKAASAQKKGLQAGLNLTQSQFAQTRGDLKPYRDIGTQAAKRLSAVNALGGGTPDFSSFYESPDYQFRLSEGNKALERSAAARGMTLSGAQLKGLSRFNQGLASQEYGNWYNRLSDLAGMGQNAAVNTGQFGANAAGTGAGMYSDMGDVAAGGIANRTNAITRGLGQLANIAGQYYKPDDDTTRSSGYKDLNF